MKGLYEDQIPSEIDPECGLPIGPKMDHPEPAKPPQRVTLEGRYCRLEPLNAARHGGELFAASTPPNAPGLFRYLADTPPASMDEFTGWMNTAVASEDPLFFAVIDRRTGRVEGRQTLMRITRAHQCIEIGNIYWGPAISRSPVTTEANFLFAQYVFEELGFRRYEWKCDSLNAPSRSAALRFGFQYEGHFRRAVITRGRTRDTAWFSIIDEEWPALKAAYQTWLAPENFDDEGNQRKPLRELTDALRAAS
jgi:RimJ/RimL family protein N-acetyltransferase